MKTSDRDAAHLHSLRIGMDKHGVLVLNLRRPSRRPVREAEGGARPSPLRSVLDRVIDYLFEP